MPHSTLPPECPVGQRFGRWTILGETRIYHIPSRPTWFRVYYLCICDCGTEKVVFAHNLLKGKTQSCGCLHREETVRRNTTHGLSHTPEYRVWESILDRIDNPNSTAFRNYGGRGIRISDEWRKFVTFYRDMGSMPSPKHTIDRIDVNGHYEPGNCRWATHREQALNKRNTRHITYQGTTLTVIEWAERQNIHYKTLRTRLESGWTIEDALTRPVRSRPRRRPSS